MATQVRAEGQAADTKKIQEVFLEIFEIRDDAQSVKRLLTKYERKPYTLAQNIVEYYYKMGAATYLAEIDAFYSELHSHLSADSSTLNKEVTGLLQPNIGPSDAHRNHRLKKIHRQIRANLKHLSLVVKIDKKTREFWEDMSRWLEDYAYCNTLDLSEYDEATGKMKDVLAAFQNTDTQHSMDMEEFLTVHNCVTAEFWDFENTDAEENDSEEDGSGEDVPSAEQSPGTGASSNGGDVITWQLQNESWGHIEKAMRACMGQFPYQEHDDVQHNYYVLSDYELGLVKFFTEEEVRKGHPNSVNDHKAGTEKRITQIDNWGE